MKKLRITVSGKVYEVDVEVLEDSGAPATRPAPAARPAAPAPAPTPAPAAPAAPAPAAAGAVQSPLAGTVVSIPVSVGQAVKAGDNLVVLEAMKMNTYVNATADGTVNEILIKPGDAVDEGQGLVVVG